METQQTSASVHAASRRLSFDTAAAWALALTGALAVIAFIPFGPASFVYTKTFILSLGGLIALALYILARLTRGNLILPPVPLLGALWLVPIAYVLSTLFSGGDMAAAFFGTTFESDTAGFIILLAVLASVAALAFRRTEQYVSFFGIATAAYGLVVLAQAGFLIASFAVPDVVAATANLVGSFADLGLFVGLGIALALVTLRLLDLSSRQELVLYVGGGVGLCILALVNSALVWSLIALVAFGLFIEAIMRRSSAAVETDFDADETPPSMLSVSESIPSKTLVPSLVTLVVALFFMIGGATVGNALSEAFGTNFIDVRPSWQSTFDIGGASYSASPLFGSGPNTFAQEWVKFRDRSLNDTIFWTIDFASGIGWIPTSFVSTGAAGALAWVAFITLFFLFGLRFLLFRAPADAYLRFVAVASFVASVYLFIISIFTVPGPVILALGFLFIGIFVSSMRFSETRREWGIVFARNPRVGFVIVFLATLLLLGSVGAVYVVVERYLADVSYNRATTMLSSGNLDGADAALDRSILFAPSDRAYRAAAASGIARLNRIASDATLPADTARSLFQQALSGSVEAAITATRLGPDAYSNWSMLGDVYRTVVPIGIEGAYENAKTAYERAVLLNPTSPVIPLALAELEIARGDTAAADTHLREAIALKQNYTQAIFRLSQLAASTGKAREALEAAEAAAYFAPDDPAVLFQVGILRSGVGDTDGAIAALARAVEVNPSFANARFFLAVAYAITGRYEDAAGQLEAISVLSPENEAAVAADLAVLRQEENPFPLSRFGALGIPQVPVSESSGGE